MASTLIPGPLEFLVAYALALAAGVLIGYVLAWQRARRVADD